MFQRFTPCSLLSVWLHNVSTFYFNSRSSEIDRKYIHRLTIKLAIEYTAETTAEYILLKIKYDQVSLLQVFQRWVYSYSFLSHIQFSVYLYSSQTRFSFHLDSTPLELFSEQMPFTETNHDFCSVEKELQILNQVESASLFALASSVPNPVCYVDTRWRSLYTCRSDYFMMSLYDQYLCFRGIKNCKLATIKELAVDNSSFKRGVVS